MRDPTRRVWWWSGLLLLVLLPWGDFKAESPATSLTLPWREAGLSEREAAAHLLDRLAFGPRPGEVDRVVEMGLEVWVEVQLAGSFAESDLKHRLAPLKSLEMATREIVETYPGPAQIRMAATRAGVLDEGMMLRAREGETGGEMAVEQAAARQKVQKWARGEGYRPQRELLADLVGQKFLRAVYAENQLGEVLTDFWFNHFNVSLTNNQSRVYVMSYERDAIRPHALGMFREMLEVTARHPAMLLYLDNARSHANEGVRTTFDRERFAESRRRGRAGFQPGNRRGQSPGRPSQGTDRSERPNRSTGLNENYARELLELHTLGVNGGYTQEDVVDVARAFTGWTVVPPRLVGGQAGRLLQNARRAGQLGFHVDDQFLFRADVHDAEKKVVLGRTLPAGRGIEDGLAVIELVAAHPATAEHLARKLAIRFVSDTPPESLIRFLAGRFLESGGNLQVVMEALVSSKEFWAPEARRQKIKSPFELTASALRALGAEIRNPRDLFRWVSRMGQPLYSYQAPTGYPDRADAWVSTGSLLSRMNFGLQLASGRLAGVRFELAALNGNREPESPLHALEIYVPLLLPERDPTETVRRLEAVVRDPALAEKVLAASPPVSGGDELFGDYGQGDFGGVPLAGASRRHGGENRKHRRQLERPPSSLEQVVGVILGSPEFQRR